MLRRANKMHGFNVVGQDDKVGTIHDFYFDDQSWEVRYVVVDTGPWLVGRRVLVSPAAFTTIDWQGEQILSPLTRDQIENSPDVDLDQPVSRQHEIALHDYYVWPYYWGPVSGMGMGGIGPIGAADPLPPATVPVPTESGSSAAVTETHTRAEAEGDPHLRSMREVDGYPVHATDGDIGKIHDFFFDETEWRIRYLLVDTGPWIFGKEVLISPDWIEKISWSDREARVRVTRERVENSPEYTTQGAIHREHETALYSHYGYPGYWV